MIIGFVASTATLSGVILYVIPSLMGAWRDGVEVGREQVQRELERETPTERPRRLYSAK